MTKTYKINNKEIEFDLPDGDYPKGVKELFFGLTHLLEALSDKEEELCTESVISYNDDGTEKDSDYWYMCLKPKPCSVHDKEQLCDCGSGLSPEVCRNNTSEPKQEKCNHPTDGDCVKCNPTAKQSTSLKEKTDWSIDSIVKEIGYIFTDDIIKLKLCVEQAEKQAKIQLAEQICAMAGDRIYSFSSGDVSRERASEIGDKLCNYLKEYIIKSKTLS